MVDFPEDVNELFNIVKPLLVNKGERDLYEQKLCLVVRKAVETGNHKLSPELIMELKHLARMKRAYRVTPQCIMCDSILLGDARFKLVATWKESHNSSSIKRKELVNFCPGCAKKFFSRLLVSVGNVKKFIETKGSGV